MYITSVSRRMASDLRSAHGELMFRILHFGSSLCEFGSWILSPKAEIIVIFATLK